MNIDITRLKSTIDEYTSIDLSYSFTKEQLGNSSILELNNVKIEGIIALELENFYIDIKVIGIMVLPCAITLKPVKYPFSIVIQEQLDEETQESLKKSQNTIDIFPIIWENVLMEIPLRIVSDDLSDACLEGNGWKLITDKE